MDIPLCGPARNVSRGDSGGGKSGIWGIFGLLSLFLLVALGGKPLLVRAADIDLHKDPLEFQAAEATSFPMCRKEISRKEGESEEDFRFRTLLSDMLQNEPIEVMVPFIAKRDRETAAFLVSIARKESSWGEHAPKKDGVDCFNYWGFKGEGSRGVGMGHACFGSPEEAIETVGNRLAELVHEKHLDSPERLIVWKCGSSCAGHSPESVAKWISDVRFIYTRVLPKG